MIRLFQFTYSTTVNCGAGIDGQFQYRLPSIKCQSCNRSLTFSSASCPCPSNLCDWPVNPKSLSREEFEVQAQSAGWNQEFQKIGVSVLPGMYFGEFRGTVTSKPVELLWLTPDQCFLSPAVLEESMRAGLGIEAFPARICSRRKDIGYSTLHARPRRLIHPLDYSSGRKWHYCDACKWYRPDWYGSLDLTDIPIDGNAWVSYGVHISRVLELSDFIVVDEEFKLWFEQRFPNAAEFLELKVV